MSINLSSRKWIVSLSSLNYLLNKLFTMTDRHVKVSLSLITDDAIPLLASSQGTSPVILLRQSSTECSKINFVRTVTSKELWVSQTERSLAAFIMCFIDQVWT